MNSKQAEWGWRILPGGVATLTIAILLRLSVLQPLEQIAYRLLFQLRGGMAWDDRLVLVAIDDSSLKQLGRFPWSRQQYTRLLQTLAKAEPSVVAIDLLWSEPSQDDAQLARAMSPQNSVVLAQAWDATGVPLKPVMKLREAAIATGHILSRADSDGLVRRISPQIQGQPAFGIAVVQAYSLVQAPVQLPPLNRSLWVNWPGPGTQLQQYSFVDVVEARVDPRAFQDKIVLVGMTATGFDPLLTPFDRTPPASSIYLHAAVINSLLQQNVLHPLSDPPLHWGVLLLLGPGLSVLISNRRTHHQLGLVGGLCLSWGCLTLVLLQFSYLAPVAYPILLCLLTGMAVILSERLRENVLLRQTIDHLWQTYHPDLVMQVGFPAPPSLPPATQSAASRVQVTQLAALAEQFGRSQSTQAAIARNLSIGVLAFDAEGQVWFCNPLATAWTQIQMGDNLHTHLEILECSQAEWQMALQTLKANQPVPSREINRDGQWFELKLEFLTYPATWKNGTAYPRSDGFLLLIENITARKQIETNLNRQVQELNQLSLLKDDFLSTVSHELRAPLSNISMVIQMLRLNPSAEQQVYYLQLLEDECNRETELIDDLLNLQRLESGATTPRLERLNLEGWLAELVEPFYSRVEARQQKLDLQIPIEVPVILSDQISLRRLLTELLNNACKYTPPGGQITVTVGVMDPREQRAIHFSVTNSGIEIPKSEWSRIFEKFYRIPSSDRWQQGGTGLGLALVKKLADHLEGSVRVESGAGLTRFTVELPYLVP
ncbi:hypothetical protein BST81_11345 [Leptolyngbya sp. 'hensonii']|uniref:CHASE2 domain-containing protein n=1 Tax=Leptolyngbya sp. 'hensonii' TaxID=1922337 RepID=UPI0009500F4F|nr:CHASE2 domain-containing protein [Leptolyngbya sp. 'hensonii']OLP18311.1 hypothetical protein BST81_11345 [Leptolyngbya sp. 'hensonii']